MVTAMTEYQYTQIMNKLFLESETVLGDEMVYLEAVGNVIREVCWMDKEENDD